MNAYGQKARDYMRKYCPNQYRQIDDPDAFFTELGRRAERQVSSTYSMISKTELGHKDTAAQMMAEETISELLYPPVEETDEFDEIDTNSVVAESHRMMWEIWAEDDSDLRLSVNWPQPAP